MHGFSVIFGPMDGIKSITFSLTINELGLESTDELTQARWDHRGQSQLLFVDFDYSSLTFLERILCEPTLLPYMPCKFLVILEVVTSLRGRRIFIVAEFFFDL